MFERKFGLIIFFVLVSPVFVGLASAEIVEPNMLVAKENGDFSEWAHLNLERELQSFDGEKHEFNVGVVLLRIGEIDKEVGSVELDFWFWVQILQEDDPIDFTVDKPEFNFINVREANLTHESCEEHYCEVQVKGVFFNEMDLNNFPFEKLNLAIEVEPEYPFDASVSYFVLDPDSAIDESAKVPGWIMSEMTLERSIKQYDEYTTYPRFVASFDVERSALGSFVKYIFPVSMITGLSLLIFYIPENFTPRIYLTAPLLLSLIYLHQGALDDIPPVGYMTMFDKLMLINYSLFITAIGSLAIQMKSHVTHKDDKRVKKINNTMRYFIPIIIVIGVVLMFE